jgi:hypothetical protein
MRVDEITINTGSDEVPDNGIQINQPGVGGVARAAAGLVKFMRHRFEK